VTLPLELAVMFHRYPDGNPGKVTSVCIKETLKVTGDGVSSIRTLMSKDIRSRFQLPRFEKEYPEILNEVPKKSKTVELEPIGNHCKGTKFLNGNKQIDERLNRAFEVVAKQMDGIYYGRFDLKCESIEAIKEGKGFMVVEFNGVGAEPAHIYDPGYPFFKKYKDFLDHWAIIYQISRQQLKTGIRPMSLWEALKSLRVYMHYMSKVKQSIQQQ
jgi:hypothetical protein